MGNVLSKLDDLHNDIGLLINEINTLNTENNELQHKNILLHQKLENIHNLKFEDFNTWIPDMLEKKIVDNILNKLRTLSK